MGRKSLAIHRDATVDSIPRVCDTSRVTDAFSPMLPRFRLVFFLHLHAGFPSTCKWPTDVAVLEDNLDASPHIALTNIVDV